MNAVRLTALLLDDYAEYRADSDPTEKPSEPEPEEFDPKEEAIQLLYQEPFLQSLGFTFYDEKDGYRRFVIDIPLERPPGAFLTLYARKHRLVTRYPILRVYARVWTSADYVSERFRLCPQLRRIAVGGDIKCWTGGVQYYDVSEDPDIAYNQMERDLNQLRAIADRVRTVRGFMIQTRHFGFSKR